MQPHDKERFAEVSFEQSLPILAKLFEAIYPEPESEAGQFPVLTVMRDVHFFNDDGDEVINPEDEPDDWTIKEIQSITIQRSDRVSDGVVEYFGWKLVFNTDRDEKDDSSIHEHFGSSQYLEVQLVNYGNAWELDFDSDQASAENRQFITKHIIEKNLKSYLIPILSILTSSQKPPEVQVSKPMRERLRQVVNTVSPDLSYPSGLTRFFTTLIDQTQVNTASSHSLNWQLIRTRTNPDSKYKTLFELVSTHLDKENAVIELVKLELSVEELNDLEKGVLAKLDSLEYKRLITQLFSWWRQIAMNTETEDEYLQFEGELLGQNLAEFLKEYPELITVVTDEVVTWSYQDLMKNLQDSPVTFLLITRLKNWADSKKFSHQTRVALQGISAEFKSEEVVFLSDPSDELNQALIIVTGLLLLINSHQNGVVTLT